MVRYNTARHSPSATPHHPEGDNEEKIVPRQNTSGAINRAGNASRVDYIVPRRDGGGGDATTTRSGRSTHANQNVRNIRFYDGNLQ